MVRQQDAIPRAIQQPRGTGDVAGSQRALETMWLFAYECNDFGEDTGFAFVDRPMSRELLKQAIAMH